jgi:uncharacterized protein (UPF0276 family)
VSQEQHRERMGLADLGVGVGLRIPHYETIFSQWPAVDWFEIISENFMVAGGRPMANLERALSRYRLVQHGVSLSIGSTDPLDRDYLARLKELRRRTESPWLSDHLCWTGAAGKNLHDLLPLPYTEEAIRHVAGRVRQVMDAIEAPFLLENVSSYLTYTQSAMTEWEFLTAVAEEADCGLLLDVNNIFVSSFNHGFDPMQYVENVPHRRVAQIHLAGHSRFERYILDTHSAPVIDEVWRLYRRAIELCGSVSTLIEWDDDIPPFETLLAEADEARTIRDEALATRRSAMANGARLETRAAP